MSFPALPVVQQPPTMFDERVAVAKYGTAAERDPMIKRGKCSSADKDLSKASFLFMVLGFGYLFPYHALAQPVDYWHLLFPTFDVDFEISCAYNIASVTTLFFIAWVGGKRKIFVHWPHRRRVCNPSTGANDPASVLLGAHI
ncbi:hypothetical protein AaE_003564 [Aphanomyces astaci]|uniref:Uncharacterized protein n=1 Tax=Aphanomyces astaci TaxID=112090 RepID=A0A6A5ALH5_APHAT|nr:hypothetical protein AaE_003564 [Aphanomyces astaci]